MMYNVIYSPRSIRSLRQIFKYLAEKSEVAPFTVVSRIRDKIDALKGFPFIGKVVEKRPRFRQLVMDKYLIFYEVIEKKRQVRIVDIIHSRRQSEIDRL